jgi:hypothetical protein
MKTIRTTAVILLSISTIGLSSAFARQPHMDRALEHLRAARAELQAAENNKGGWKERALQHVDRAIADTERGRGFAAGH